MAWRKWFRIGDVQTGSGDCLLIERSYECIRVYDRPTRDIEEYRRAFARFELFRTEKMIGVLGIGHTEYNHVSRGYRFVQSADLKYLVSRGFGLSRPRYANDAHTKWL